MSTNSPQFHLLAVQQHMFLVLFVVCVCVLLFSVVVLFCAVVFVYLL